MRLSGRCAIAVSILCCMGRPLPSQQVAHAADAMTTLDGATQVALNREINSARDRGLPIEPLLAKVREGHVKRAPAMRIRVAVSMLARRLDSARAGLGPDATPQELAAGAEAIASGAEVASLRALRAATTRSIAAPLGTFAQMLVSGVKQPQALEALITLLRRNATPAQVLALGNRIESDIASGLRPDEAALFRLRGIEGTLGLGGTADALTASPGVPTTVTPPPSPPAKPTRRP